MKKILGVSNFEELPEDIAKFAKAIENTYESFDIDKKLLENTIIINTEELNELNLKIQLENELRLKGLIEQAPYGFVIVDYDGEVVDANKFASDTLGYEKRDLVSCKIESLFKSRENFEFQDLRDKIMRGEKISFDEVMKTSVNSDIPVEITAGKFIIKETPHILIMFQDIIERVQAEKMARQKQLEIENLNKQLEERVQQEVIKNLEKDQLLIQQSKMAAIGDMMGNIAHQWRQPLNNLSIAIQDVEEAFLFDELNGNYIEEFIENSMSNVRFMSKTIDDFRNFFKPTKSKVEFKLKEAIEDILKIVSAQLKNNNISISIDGENYSVIGYPNEFKQVILNLTNNAKDAIIENRVEGGKIEIAISDSDDEKYKLITIQDNGGGIPKHVISRIFEPYFTTKKGNKGTGIGLYMSKTIIEGNMSGELLVKNENGGAKFYLSLPHVVKLKN
jgi:PAS domain S-box-containing protein